MILYLLNLWNKKKSNFLIFPSFMALLTIVFSYITLYLDRHYHINNLAFFWEGGAEGARQLLATISGSIITITGVVFSITIVSVALASNQYGSRSIQNFMKDVGTQIVLGTFISTSLYALLILRTIRTDLTENFIPNLSITISLGLGIISLILLSYFIHHISKSVQSSEIISRISSELLENIKNLKNNDFEDEKKIKKNIATETECYKKLISSEIGYLQTIDYKKINEIAEKEQIIIEIYTRPGLFLLEGSLLGKINSNEIIKNQILEAFIIGNNRTSTQDIEYLFDQLVSITLHFLSANNNDTYSTNYCIDQLGAALSILCSKSLSPFHPPSPHIRLISHQLTYEGVLDTAFNQIRQFAKEMPSVIIHLLETFTIILEYAKTREQIFGLKKHALMVHSLEELFQEQDKIDLKDRFKKFEKVFNSKEELLLS